MKGIILDTEWLMEHRKSLTQIRKYGDFPDGPEAKTLHSVCRETGFPWGSSWPRNWITHASAETLQPDK